MPVSVPSGGLAARVVVALIALLALALTVRTGLGFALAGRQPALAASVDASNGSALAARAEAVMLAAEDDADIAEVERLARAALLASPLEASALRNVGFIMAVTGRERAARRVLELAGKASQRDYLTHAWLLNAYFEDGRVFDAIRQADIVLRQDVRVWPTVMPELAKLLSDRRSIEPLARTLAAKPYWRSSFLQTLGGDGVNRDAGFSLLRRLQALGAPATTAERQPYFSSIATVEPRLLYQRWNALLERPLPRDQALLRDGGFAGFDAPGPFNWTNYPRDGVYAERSAGPEGAGGALYMAFDGTALANFSTQKLVLSAGRYRLSGRAYGDGPVDPSRFALQIRCGEAGAELARAAIAPRADAWTPFALDVTVPASCPAQHIWFMGLAGQTLNPAAIWVDDLVLRPAR